MNLQRKLLTALKEMQHQVKKTKDDDRLICMLLQSSLLLRQKTEKQGWWWNCWCSLWIPVRNTRNKRTVTVRDRNQYSNEKEAHDFSCSISRLILDLYDSCIQKSSLCRTLFKGSRDQQIFLSQERNSVEFGPLSLIKTKCRSQVTASSFVIIIHYILMSHQTLIRLSLSLLSQDGHASSLCNTQRKLFGWPNEWDWCQTQEREITSSERKETKDHSSREERDPDNEWVSFLVNETRSENFFSKIKEKRRETKSHEGRKCFTSSAYFVQLDFSLSFFFFLSVGSTERKREQSRKYLWFWLRYPKKRGNTHIYESLGREAINHSFRGYYTKSSVFLPPNECPLFFEFRPNMSLRETHSSLLGEKPIDEYLQQFS